MRWSTGGRGNTDVLNPRGATNSTKDRLISLMYILGNAGAIVVVVVIVEVVAADDIIMVVAGMCEVVDGMVVCDCVDVKTVGCVDCMVVNAWVGGTVVAGVEIAGMIVMPGQTSASIIQLPM